MPVRLGAAAQQSFRLGAAPVTRMYVGAVQVYSSAPPEPPAPRPDMPAPSSLTAVGANATAALTWTLGVTATSHVIQKSTDGGVTWSGATASATGQPTATVTGLTNGLSYRFRVAAQTALGLTPFSAPSAAVRPIGPPGVPASLAISLRNLTWRAPDDTGGSLASDITYILQRGTGSAGSQVWSVYETLIGVTQYALTASCTDSYWWRIAANTAGGQSAYSSAIQQSAVAVTSPPKNTTAAAWVQLYPATSGLAVHWNGVAEPPSAACDSPSHYEVWIRPRTGDADTSCGSLSQFSLAATVPVLSGSDMWHIYTETLGGLKAGTQYYVAVRAINSAGVAPHACAKYAMAPGDQWVPSPPQFAFGTSWGSGQQVWVPSIGAIAVEFENMHGVQPLLFGRASGIPYESYFCAEGAQCGDPLGKDGCLIGPYHTWTWSGSAPATASQSSGGGGRWRIRYKGITGVPSPWAYLRWYDFSCTTSPTPDVPGQPDIYYVRGGKQSIRVQRTPVIGEPCLQGMVQQSPTDWWLEYRTIAIASDAGGNQSPTSGWGAWVPMTVNSTEGFVATVPATSVLEVRLRAENDWGIGAAGSPVPVRTLASGGTLASALSATGSMLFDDASQWTQSVLSSPSTHMAAGRYFTVSRHCIVSLSVALGTTNSGASPASASVAVADASGTLIGYVAHKTRTNATVRLAFYAKPNRRYSVEVADTANSTTAITNCYSEDIYDEKPFTSVAKPCFKYQQMRPSVSALLTPSSHFAFTSSRDGSAAEWLGPAIVQRTYTLDENEYFVRAETKCRIYYKVTGQWQVFLGTFTQRRVASLWTGTAAQSTSGHRHIDVDTGQYVTIAPNGGTTATVNYLYAEVWPNTQTSLPGSEFNSVDALGGESGMLAAGKNGL